jgi:hypothetical protein
MDSPVSDHARAEEAVRVRKSGRSVRLLQLGALAAASLAFSILFGEITLRLTFPAHRFLNPNQDCFWTVRLRHQFARHRMEPSFAGGQHDSLIGWKPQPNLRGPAQNTNSRGIRGVTEYSYERPPRVPRLIVHGDSFTWGLGVSDSETYSSRLATLLPGSEVINMGINGHGIDQQYLYWLAEGRRYQPDVVILGFFVPDFHRSMLAIREHPKPRFSLGDRGLNLIGVPVPTPQQYLDDCALDCRSTSRVLDLASAGIRRMRAREPEDSFLHKSALTKAILASWSESLSETQAEFCLVVIPQARYREYPDHERIEQLLQRSAQENGFAFLNLTDGLREFEMSGRKAFLESNGHWSADGHSFAASQIADLLNASQRFAADDHPERTAHRMRNDAGSNTAVAKPKANAADGRRSAPASHIGRFEASGTTPDPAGGTCSPTNR